MTLAAIPFLVGAAILAVLAYQLALPVLNLWELPIVSPWDIVLLPVVSRA